MSNQNNSPQVITPDAGNVVTAAYGGWDSKPVSAPGVPGGRAPDGSSHLQFLLAFNFDTATDIEILPEHASPEAPAAWFPMGLRNVLGEAENDSIKLVAANLEPGQTSIDLPLAVPASHFVRLRARATGAGPGTTLDAKVLGGRW